MARRFFVSDKAIVSKENIVEVPSDWNLDTEHYIAYYLKLLEGEIEDLDKGLIRIYGYLIYRDKEMGENEYSVPISMTIETEKQVLEDIQSLGVLDPLIHAYWKWVSEPRIEENYDIQGIRGIPEEIINKFA